MSKVKQLKDALKMIGLDLRSIKRPTKIREGYEKNLIKYNLVSNENAKNYVTKSKQSIYEVVTINWSYCKDEEITDYDNVYKNTYHLTLSELFKFKLKSGIAPEDIISIKLVE